MKVAVLRWAACMLLGAGRPAASAPMHRPVVYEIFVLPLELSSLVQGVAGYADVAFRSTQPPSASDGSTTEPAPSAVRKVR